MTRQRDIGSASRPERQIAFHEAAHAVVGAALGLPVERVTIAAEEGPGYSIRESQDHLRAVDAMTEDGVLWIHAHIYCTAAGPVADSFLSGSPVEWSDPCRGGDCAELGSYARQILSSEVDPKPLYRRGERGARLLLHRHWERVETFAELLLTEHTLEGDHLAAAVEGLGTRRGARARFAERYAAPDWLE